MGLQGNMSQPQRDRAMNGFRSGTFDILVATDIAARGLDVAGVDYVINFDPPNTPDTYTHRIGRTGRSEASGIACTFVTMADSEWIRDTERMLGERIELRRYEGFDWGEGRPPGNGQRQQRRSSPRGGGGGGGGGGGSARRGKPRRKPAGAASGSSSGGKRSGGRRRR